MFWPSGFLACPAVRNPVANIWRKKMNLQIFWRKILAIVSIFSDFCETVVPRGMNDDMLCSICLMVLIEDNLLGQVSYLLWPFQLSYFTKLVYLSFHAPYVVGEVAIQFVLCYSSSTVKSYALKSPYSLTGFWDKSTKMYSPGLSGVAGVTAKPRFGRFSILKSPSSTRV